MELEWFWAAAAEARLGVIGAVGVFIVYYWLATAKARAEALTRVKGPESG
jgi:hypothetical protein